MPYTIGGREFKSKQTVTDYFSHILRTNKVGTKLPKNFEKDVIILLQFHTERDEKIGCGIDHIKTEKHLDAINGFYSNTQHFHIYRTDGTDIDFSYKNCVNNMGKSGYKGKKKDDLTKSFRFVVRPQIDAFRTKAFGKKQYLKCEVLGVNFSKKTCHVDHIPPMTFQNLFDNFLEHYGLTIEEIETQPVDNIYDTVKDEAIRNNWYNYHQKHAQLRVIHKTANLAQKKSEKIKIE